MTFIQENQITPLNKDPTDLFQKQIQQALQKCSTLVKKKQTQMSDEHKTYITKVKCVHKNT